MQHSAPSPHQGAVSESTYPHLQVDRALVGGEVEEIVRGFRRRPVLLVTKHQVNPLIQMRGHVLALQRLALHPHELLGGAVGPRRQLHVTQGLSVLPHAQLVVVAVVEELGLVVKLRDQLLDVLRTPTSFMTTSESRGFTRAADSIGL